MAVVSAGHGKKISGEIYRGLYEFHRIAWVVDDTLYVQCENTGNWHRKEDEHCGCDESCPASLVNLVRRAISEGRCVEMVEMVEN